MRKHQNPDSPFNWIVIVRLLAALIELVRQLSDQFPRECTWHRAKRLGSICPVNARGYAFSETKQIAARHIGNTIIACRQRSRGTRFCRIP
jgi:hypothetical protein